MKKYLTLLAMLLMTGLGTVRAQNEQPVPQEQEQQTAPQDQEAPPPDDQSQVAASADTSNQAAPGVARLSYIHGNVSTQRGDNGDWVGVTLNTPIMVGDRVSTGDGAKAEIQLDWANVLRMSSNATVKIANITRNSIQVQVGQGLVTYSVLPNAEATAEIDTPNAAIHPTAEGEYRILVSSDGESSAVVRRGGADVSTPQGSTHVNEGQMITVQGTDNPQYKIDPAPGRDDWDSWNNDRDRVIDRAENSRHTNRYYVGSQDLDAYGHWEDVPDYGQVWVPSEGADWAPYRDGRWVWEPYYGWTWIGYEPWGWAPYHYGRWFVYGGSWAWWPGPIYAYPAYYPIWSPAYVSFFGWGGGWGFGVGFGWGGWGHVGWLPCGPGDWYHPWWGHWGGRGVVGFDRLNSLHEGFRPLGRSTWHQYSNFNEAFRNDRIRSGISSMDGRDFGRAAVSAHQERISEATLRTASMNTGRMPEPGRGSYSPTGRAADPRSYNHAPSSSQRFFTASRANGSPNSFGARANANFASRPTSTSRSATNFNNARAGNSFERPNATVGASGNANRGGTPITSSRPGWHTFTPPSGANTNRGANGAIHNSSRGFESQRSTSPYGNSQYENRGYANSSRGGYDSSRPSLNMRQPIVTPRNNGGYGSYGSRGSGGYGYSSPRPSYSQPRPSYSAPRSYSAPHSYSAPRSSSAPRGGSTGGGGSRGGGGGHPSGGGSHGHGH